MPVTFFNIKSIVHFEFIPQGQKVKHSYCMEILKRLRDAVRRKGLNFGPIIEFSITTMLQPKGALCQAVSGPKIDY
jgi:hypothetical protein